jgi:hypothetical protein
MNQTPKFQYYKLEGPGLELLKAYKKELDAFLDGRDKLNEEFAERAKQQAEYHQANLRAMWRRLAASVGLNPDNTWASQEYQIEVRYIDDGFGAILYMPRHLNPAKKALGDEPIAQPQDPANDIPPEGTTKH